jgi:hypothetical protein
MRRILPDVVKRKGASLRGDHCRQFLQALLHCLCPAIDEEQGAAEIPNVPGQIPGLGVCSFAKVILLSNYPVARQFE